MCIGKSGDDGPRIPDDSGWAGGTMGRDVGCQGPGFSFGCWVFRCFIQMTNEEMNRNGPCMGRC